MVQNFSLDHIALQQHCIQGQESKILFLFIYIIAVWQAKPKPALIAPDSDCLLFFFFSKMTLS